MRGDYQEINEDISDLPHLLKVRQSIDYIFLSTHIYVITKTACAGQAVVYINP